MRRWLVTVLLLLPVLAQALARSEKLLLNILPGPVAERLKNEKQNRADDNAAAERDKKKLAESKAAIAGQASEAGNEKDGNALVQVGYAYVTLGEVDKGIELIEAGIKKGGLKRPEDAKLRLGMAQLQSAKAKGKATQTLRSVQGTDGANDIARLWVILGAV